LRFALFNDISLTYQKKKKMYWKILRDGIGVSSPKMLDHSIFHLHINVGYILLVLYVDDIVIARDESGGVTRLKQFLQ
jgi:hypothetical protein